MLNEDYKNILLRFIEERVKFLLVGAYAMAAQGYPRATMDIDIWIQPCPKNAAAVRRALNSFGASLLDISRKDLETENMVFRVGEDPRRIDIITTASGLEFEETFANSVAFDIEGIEIHIPSLADLIRATSGRREERKTGPMRKPSKNCKTGSDNLSLPPS